jgi:putative component of toxin-antitoxin plasmid stabilization module
MSGLVLLYQGQQFTIYAYGEDDAHCEVTDFLEDRQVLAAADEKKFQDLFIRHGDHGPIRDETKCRHLDDGIWEYKARHGGRIAWFYVPGALVICACGVVKKSDKADPEFIRRAKAIRERYRQEQSHE